PVALRQDDFSMFFNQRFERLLKQIEAAMGKPVNRAADGSRSPFMDPAREADLTRGGVQALIGKGEGKVVEFKSTGRTNLRTGDKDPRMEWAVVKTIAGFMNAHGGTLLVGVGDGGAIVGLEADFPHLKKPDCDRWELWLTDAVASKLGKPAAAELDVRIVEVDGGHVARIDVGPAAAPVFGTPPGATGPSFLVRINNTTQELVGQDAHEYQRRRWAA
ncbi:MAG: ATP-binding protein, partial [Solirubrobacteraceae bacterium]